MNAPTLAALILYVLLLIAVPHSMHRFRPGIAAIAGIPGAVLVVCTYADPASLMYTLGGVALVMWMVTTLVTAAGWFLLRIFYYPRNRRARAIQARQQARSAYTAALLDEYQRDPGTVFLPQTPTPPPPTAPDERPNQS